MEEERTNLAGNGNKLESTGAGATAGKSIARSSVRPPNFGASSELAQNREELLETLASVAKK